jgi:hypothetical protein
VPPKYTDPAPLICPDIVRIVRVADANHRKVAPLATESVPEYVVELELVELKLQVVQPTILTLPAFTLMLVDTTLLPNMNSSADPALMILGTVKPVALPP